jgi:hypothetical protein
MSPAENRPRNFLPVSAGETITVRPDRVCLRLCLLNDRLPGERATGGELVETLLAAAHQHIDAVVDGLFGDRAEPGSAGLPRQPARLPGSSGHGAHARPRPSRRAVPEAAESVTSSGTSAVPFWTAYVVYSPVTNGIGTHGEADAASRSGSWRWASVGGTTGALPSVLVVLRTNDYGPGFRRALSNVLAIQIEAGTVDPTSDEFVELFERAEPGTIVRALVEVAAQLAVRQPDGRVLSDDQAVVQAKVAVDQVLEVMSHPPLRPRPA